MLVKENSSKPLPSKGKMNSVESQEMWGASVIMFLFYDVFLMIKCRVPQFFAWRDLWIIQPSAQQDLLFQLSLP